jgi:DNA polymerase-3 subunit chi
MSCRVDFYVQSGGPAQGHLTLACRVTEKAFQAGHQVYIRCSSVEQAKTLDQLLWTFSQNSFVPHSINGTDKTRTPVTIGHEPANSAIAQVVVSLAEDPVADFTGFLRIAEIVGNEGTDRESGRRRYRFYRENGIEPATHEIKL